MMTQGTQAPDRLFWLARVYRHLLRKQFFGTSTLNAATEDRAPILFGHFALPGTQHQSRYSLKMLPGMSKAKN